MFYNYRWLMFGKMIDKNFKIEIMKGDKYFRSHIDIYFYKYWLCIYLQK